MSAPPEPATPPAAPGQGRLPLRTKCTWALGSLGDNYAGNTMNSLKDPVYTVALGVPPELIGWALSVPRLLDALVDPVVGLLSDRWRGRWGRRRPFIAAGAIPLGLAMMLLWNPPSGGRWSHEALAGYFLGCTLLFYCAYSLFLVPYRALGLELTSDYHERTRLQAWGMIVGLVGGLGLPWLYKLALILGGSDGSATGATPAVIIAGAQWVGFGVGALIIATCLAPALFVRERPLARPSGRLRGTRAFLTTLRNRAFLHMLGMNFCAIVGMYAPVTATLILNIYFLFDGNQDAAATLTGYAGMAQLIGSLAGVPVNTWLSVRFGKRTTALASLALAGAGFLSLWFTLQPVAPYWYVLSAFVIGWGTQGVWLMSATMNADVCDSDELDTVERREGLYGAVFALEQKLALACAALLGGYVASLCGYDAGTAPDAHALELLRRCVVAIPLIGVGAAAFFCFSYPLSHARLLTVQAKLRERSP